MMSMDMFYDLRGELRQERLAELAREQCAPGQDQQIAQQTPCEQAQQHCNSPKPAPDSELCQLKLSA